MILFGKYPIAFFRPIKIALFYRNYLLHNCFLDLGTTIKLIQNLLIVVVLDVENHTFYRQFGST